MLKQFTLASVGIFVSASTVAAAPVQWTVESGGNGHYYEFIGDDEDEVLQNFENALSTAASLTHEGLSGHLVTITSAGEQQFLEDLLDGAVVDFFIGASDAATEGMWEWVAGPEAGTLIGTGNSPSYVAASYDNWSEFEPNDFNGEDYGAFNFFFEQSGGVERYGQWNDLPSFGNGYIVEYSQVSEVPLPASLPLLLIGGVALGLVRRRRS